MKARLMFANGTKDNHAQGICINSDNAQQHLEEFRSIIHKKDYKILDEGKEYITVHFPYDGLFADGIRTYYIE